MRNMSFFSRIGICILLTLAACKKDKSPQPQPQFKGSFSAEINGKTWATDLDFDAGALSDSIFDIGVAQHDGEGHQFAWLSLAQLNLNRKCDTLFSFSKALSQSGGGTYMGKACCIFSLGDGDAVANSYAPLETAINLLTIDSYDATNRQIKGHFQLTMYRTDNRPEGAWYGYSDTLKFTNGQFDLQIKAAR